MIPRSLAAVLLCLLCIVFRAVAEMAPTPGALVSLMTSKYTAAMAPAPTAVERDVTSMFAALDRGVAPRPDELDDIVMLASTACSRPNAFHMATRWDAEGAGNAVRIHKNFQDLLHALLATNIAMHAMYADVLRYAAPLDAARYAAVYRRCVATPPPVDTVRTDYFLRYEETTPNPDAGAAYTYTSVCALIRARVAGRDTLIFSARMLGPSSVGLRGVAVGNPWLDLYYYSDRPGTNLRGLTWADTYIYASRMLSVFVDLGNNDTALLSCSWVRAGWNGINVVDAQSIYQNINRSLRRMRLLCEYPRITNRALAACAERVRLMPADEVNAMFARYCAYVRYCKEQESTSIMPWVRTPLLTQLYDPRTFAHTTDYQKRALILHEYVRIIAGHPTWSHDDNFHPHAN